uniref:RxLR effector candidate protein n=1 Tax=Hyaloperonospora arabidopsidis (strain Emoy2) TaxID=559515 RepID=M4C0K6_HYAAE
MRMDALEPVKKSHHPGSHCRTPQHRVRKTRRSSRSGLAPGNAATTAAEELEDARVERFKQQRSRRGTRSSRCKSGHRRPPAVAHRVFGWDHTFLHQVNMAQAQHGLLWMEDVKVNLLGHYLSDMARAILPQASRHVVARSAHALLRDELDSGDVQDVDHGSASNKSLCTTEGRKAQVARELFLPRGGRRRASPSSLPRRRLYRKWWRRTSTIRGCRSHRVCATGVARLATSGRSVDRRATAAVAPATVQRAERMKTAKKAACCWH